MKKFTKTEKRVLDELMSARQAGHTYCMRSHNQIGGKRMMLALLSVAEKYDLKAEVYHDKQVNREIFIKRVMVHFTKGPIENLYSIFVEG